MRQTGRNGIVSNYGSAVMAKKSKQLLAKVRDYFENTPQAGRQSGPVPGLPLTPISATPSSQPTAQQPVQQAWASPTKPLVAPLVAQAGQACGIRPGQPVTGLEFEIVGDTLRVWRTEEGAPLFDPHPEAVARKFLLWLERNLPERKFVSVEELSLLYSAFCAVAWSRQRYPLNPLILRHLGRLTKKTAENCKE